MKLGAAAGLIVACASTPQPTHQTSASISSSDGEVVSITDGDTIEVMTGEGEITVRLAAINTPDEGECHHRAATSRIEEVLSRALVSLEIVGVDQFDRTLAHVFVDERHVNLEMVSAGLAVVSDPDATDPHGSALLDAEDDAFDSRVGLWAGDACGATDPPPGVAIDPAGSRPDPPGPDDHVLTEELVAIVNRSGDTVDIGGWTLRDTSSRHRFVFPEGTSLRPREVVEVDSGAAGWDPGGSPVWNNDGDMALLLDAAGRVVSRWRY